MDDWTLLAGRVAALEAGFWTRDAVEAPVSPLGREPAEARPVRDALELVVGRLRGLPGDPTPGRTEPPSRERARGA